jgi:hypothetical protein
VAARFARRSRRRGARRGSAARLGAGSARLGSVAAQLAAALCGCAVREALAAPRLAARLGGAAQS